MILSKSKTAKQCRKRKCNLKQTDIFTAFQNWKSIQQEKDMKNQILLTEIIVVEDSDSESTSAAVTLKVINLPKTKRPLAASLSDDEDEQVTPVTKQETEIRSLPIRKRPLKAPIFDEEDDSEENNNSNCAGSRYNQMKPIACSSPLFPLNQNELDHLNTHVGRDILDTSQAESDCSDSVTVTENDTTIHIDRNLPSQGKIRIIANTVVSPGKNICLNVPSTPQNSRNTENVANSSKKRCADQKTPIKKQKTTVNDTSKRKPEQTKTSSEQSVNIAGHDDQTAGGKDNIHDKCDKIKACAQTDNTLKVSSKENLPHCSKDKYNTNVGNRDENSPSGKNTSMEETTDRAGSVNQKTVKDVGNVSKNLNIGKDSGSPKKSLDAIKFPGGSIKPKKEERKINKKPLILIMKLFNTVLSCKQVNNLLEDERDVIRKFLSMKDDRYQFACLKLFVRQRKWYNAFKFNKLILLDMEETDVCDMVREFERNGIVDTEYMGEEVLDLLQRLDNTELRSICDKFRMKKTLKTKRDMIDSLIKYSSTQPTLSNKTTKELLLEEIRMTMGRCMRVSEAFCNAFYSTYLLGTFTNYRFLDTKDYFETMRHEVIFPKVPIDDYAVFRTRADFVSYSKAINYRKELETCSDPLLCLQICKTIFTQLKLTENDKRDEERFQDAPHLIKFTARAVYAGALTFMVEKLFAKFHEDVKEWLEYLIKKVNYPHRVGYWYHYLIWLYMRYLKKYDRAARLLIDVLHRKREHLSEVQLYTLRKRGEQLICTVKYKLKQMDHDLIAELLPKPIPQFPEQSFRANCIRSNDIGKKRNYEQKGADGTRTIFKVEDVALTRYMETLRFTGGAHCEGAYIKATFTLFFFDIIYSAEKVVPGTFLSELQSEPLDMNSRHFYPNRKEQIDRRLRDIESEWSDAKVVKFVKDSYEKHSHEYTLCEIGNIIKDVEFLEVLVECIGRRVLAKIYERLVKNFREFRSGLPDLLLWNADKKECKFVEVKGENDKLSVGQTLWLNYLRTIGAEIEVCLVHSIGSKGKVKKVDKKLPEASTSSSTGEVQ